jgi:hypothetical protein
MAHTSKDFDFLNSEAFQTFINRVTPMLYRSNIFKSRDKHNEISESDDDDDALCGLEFYVGNIIIKCKKLKCEFTVDL